MSNCRTREKLRLCVSLMITFKVTVTFLVIQCLESSANTKLKASKKVKNFSCSVKR